MSKNLFAKSTVTIRMVLCIFSITLYAQDGAKSHDQTTVLRYVGGNQLMSKISEIGVKNVSIYSAYERHMKAIIGEEGYNKTTPLRDMRIEYDEIWKYKRTEYLTSREIRENAATLDIWTFYFKSGVLQAHTVERFFYNSPLSRKTQKTITAESPKYKVTNILDRTMFLRLLQGK